MTPRERFLRIMRYEPVDRLPVMAVEPFEPTAIERWRGEGLPEGEHPVAFLGMSELVHAPAGFGPIPPFEPEVISEDEEYIVERSNMGAVLRRRKDMAQKLDLARFLENTTEFIHVNRNPVRILFREFLDGGVLLEELLPGRILPIFRLWREYYPRFFSAQRGSPREADHMLLTLSGMSLFYFLVVPLMEQVWE